jgi:RNA polymerase sigma factor (sigma-70 family)
MKQGDREAGSLFLSKYIDVVYRTLSYDIGGVTKQDLQNLTQSVCVTIWEELPKYRPEFAVSTWVNMLVKRHRMAYLRERKKQDDRLSFDGAINPKNPGGVRFSEAITDPAPNALKLLVDNEEALEKQRRLDYACLSFLQFLATLSSDEDRDVFSDRELVGLSYADIGEKRNLTLDAVKARLRRTRLRWAAFLTERRNIE